MTEQEMREKVIKELECCVSLNHNGSRCANCDYADEFHNGDCETYLLSDALALLKVQEPRVMTLEEVSKWYNVPESERDPIYVEYLPNSGLGISRWTTEYFGFNPNSYPNRNSGYYGKWLRCWTSRPDEKRRAETPWTT